MTIQVLTNATASIAALKADPMKVIASGEGFPVAILNRNKPAFYCVPVQAYEAMMDLIEDVELLKLVQARSDEETVKVGINT